MNKMSNQNEEARISIVGMHCMMCVGKVERALKGKQGVLGASVNLARAEATVQYNSSEVDLEGLKEVIKNTGYAAHVIGSD